MKAASLLLTVSLWGASAAHAQTTTYEMRVEAAGRFHKADGELNRVYQQIRAQLEPEERSKLVAAQRAWLSFREAECELEAMHVGNSSFSGVLLSNCRARLTYERTKDLRSVTLDCEEGDVGCVIIGKSSQ